MAGTNGDIFFVQYRADVVRMPALDQEGNHRDLLGGLSDDREALEGAALGEGVADLGVVLSTGDIVAVVEQVAAPHTHIQLQIGELVGQ